MPDTSLCPQPDKSNPRLAIIGLRLILILPFTLYLHNSNFLSISVFLTVYISELSSTDFLNPSMPLNVN